MRRIFIGIPLYNSRDCYGQFEMYKGDMQSVLRCGQCNKPFDERELYFHQIDFMTPKSVLTVGHLESTLKRHGYYCRSRRTGSTTRSRSCISCARGKAGCDNRQPKCSRCITKTIECCYPANTLKGKGPRIQQSDNAPTEWRKTAASLEADSPSFESRQGVSSNADINLASALGISDPDFANTGGEYLDWDVQDIDFADFLNPQMNDETVQTPSSRLSVLVRPSTASTDRTFQVHQTSYFSNISMPTLPSSTGLRSLILRPKLKTGAQRIANLILSTLKSYPLMMLRHNTLPPFIHPRLISSNVENNHMEPLTNCISLMHMISSGVQGSRKLFWKNVRMECERLHEEVSQVCDVLIRS
jgi:hypothetical protein